MNKQLYIILCMALLLLALPLTSALSTDGQAAYYKADTSGSFPDAHNGYDGTINGATYITNGKINGAYSFDGDNDYVDLNFGSGLDPTQNRSINFWIKTSSSVASLERWMGVEGSGSLFERIVAFSQDDISFDVRDSLANRVRVSFDGSASGADIFDGTWHMITLVKSGNTANDISWYVDGSSVSTNVVTSSTLTSSTTYGYDFFLGTTDGVGSPAGDYSNITFDEIGFWNISLTSNNVSGLYNSGGGLQYPYTTAGTEYFSISNVENGLNNYNATINNIFYSTTNGTINTNINQTQGILANITIRANTYFNKEYTNYNTSTDLTNVNLTRHPKIVVKDSYDNTNITNDNTNITINGTSYTRGTIDSEGYLYAPYNGTFNVNITSDSYLRNDASRTLTPDTTQNINLDPSRISFQAFEKISGTQIYNFTINDSTNTDTTTNGTATIVLPAGNNQQITFTNTEGYYNTTTTINVSAKDEKTINITTYNHKLTIQAKDFFTNATLTNMTINIVDKNGKGYNETRSTLGNNITFNISNLYNYTSTINLTDYASASANHTNLTSLNSTYTYYLFKENSVYIRIYDEQTGNIINDRNVSVEFISDNLAVENQTDTGALIVEPLLAGFYRIRYSAEEYPERIYFATVTSGSTQTIDVFLLNASVATNITATVNDETGNPVQGSYVKLLRYYLDCNCYLTVEIGQTNYEGSTGLLAQYNSEFYKFIIEYQNTTYLETTPFKITSTSLTFTITLDEVTAGNTLTNIQELSYSLSYNNATNNFKYTFNDPKNAVVKGCLKVYRITPAKQTLYNQTCVESGGATILINAPARNFTTYKAVATADFNDGNGDTTIDVLTHSYGTGGEITGKLGLLLAALIILTMAFIGVWNPTVSVVLTGVTLLIMSVTGLISVANTITIGALATVIIIIILQNKS